MTTTIAQHDKDRRFSRHRAAHGAKGLHKAHEAVTGGRTLFPSRVTSPADVDRVLISGFNNRKIGGRVRVGRWKGFPIYTLTLEERATCPRSCHHWRTCYGNGMQWPKRHRHGPELIEALERDLSHLNATTGGFVVRLHVLGDFYSADYVRQWGVWLNRFENLRVFGYTAWPANTEIGAAIRLLTDSRWDRFAIRQSLASPTAYRREAITMHPDTLPLEDHKMIGGFACPAQKKDEKYCGNCAACWESNHNVVFVSHGK